MREQDNNTVIKNIIFIDELSCTKDVIELRKVYNLCFFIIFFLSFPRRRESINGKCFIVYPMCSFIFFYSLDSPEGAGHRLRGNDIVVERQIFQEDNL